MTGPEVRQDFTLTLETETPLHVGGVAGDPVVDLPLATDGQGQLMVPGRSWAGVLRAFARRTHDVAEVDALFGAAPRGGDGPATDDDPGHASRLFVSDTAIGAVGLEMRTGVGIDRRSGAAAARILYDRMVVPAGTTLTLRLRHEGPSGDAATRLVAQVRAAGLTVGGASRRGLGRLRCTAAHVQETDLTRRGSLLATLAGRSEPTDIQPAEGVAAAVPRFEIRWAPRRPVVVGSAAPGEQADLVPLLTRTPSGGLLPVLPGSTVKGVLRSLAERVVRTVRDLGPPRDDFTASLEELAHAVPAFGLLFGSRERAGALSVPDVTAVAPDPVAPDSWQGYLAGTVSPATSWTRERTHVALDRWSGGAAQHRLFTVQETRDLTWQPLRLELDPDRLNRATDQHRRAAVVLLGVAVALLAEGHAGFGHATTRGLGEVEVSGVDVVGVGCWDVPDHDGTSDLWSWLERAAGHRLLEELVHA